MHAFSRANHPSLTSFRRRKSCALGAAAVAALLATTACDPSGTDRADGTTPADPPSATGSAKPGEPTTAPAPKPTSTSTSTSKPTPSGGSDDGNDGNGGGGGNGGAGSTIAVCTAADLSFSSTNEDEKGKEVRHLLLAATNVSHKKCNLYRYPDVRFATDAGSVAVIKDSDLKEPATLAPGEVAYAALLAGGGHMDTYGAKSILVRLQGSTSDSALGRTVTVALPAGVKVVDVDNGALVTHWIPTASGLALRFIMSR
ncbi:DUF4232 domain-containing protein [Streptomyces laurentii]|uniref:DUF4232 domain-containing protein n=1 Tax=Streptomyces laurentii TaxID=39478 RepID=UPI0036D0A9B4